MRRHLPSCRLGFKIWLVRLWRNRRQRAQCQIAKWLSYRPHQYNQQQPHNSCKLMCALCSPLIARLNFIKGLYTFSRFNILSPFGLRTTMIQHPPSQQNDCIKAMMSPRMGFTSACQIITSWRGNELHTLLQKSTFAWELGYNPASWM